MLSRLASVRPVAVADLVGVAALSVRAGAGFAPAVRRSAAGLLCLCSVLWCVASAAGAVVAPCGVGVVSACARCACLLLLWLVGCCGWVVWVGLLVLGVGGGIGCCAFSTCRPL